jgi:hypothetical protein
MQFLSINDIEGQLLTEDQNGRTWQTQSDHGNITKQAVFRGKTVSHSFSTPANILFVRGMGKVNQTNVWSNDIVQLKENELCSVTNIGDTNLIYLIFS